MEAIHAELELRMRNVAGARAQVDREISRSERELVGLAAELRELEANRQVPEDLEPAAWQAGGDAPAGAGVLVMVGVEPFLLAPAALSHPAVAGSALAGLADGSTIEADRDPAAFRLVWRYLNGSVGAIPSSQEACMVLVQEALWWRLAGVAQAVSQYQQRLLA
jgi:hypothetical protein